MGGLNMSGSGGFGSSPETTGAGGTTIEKEGDHRADWQSASHWGWADTDSMETESQEQSRGRGSSCSSRGASSKAGSRRSRGKRRRGSAGSLAAAERYVFQEERKISEELPVFLEDDLIAEEPSTDRDDTTPAQHREIPIPRELLFQQITNFHKPAAEEELLEPAAEEERLAGEEKSFAEGSHQKSPPKNEDLMTASDAVYNTRYDVDTGTTFHPPDPKNLNLEDYIEKDWLEAHQNPLVKKWKKLKEQRHDNLIRYLLTFFWVYEVLAIVVIVAAHYGECLQSVDSADMLRQFFQKIFGCVFYYHLRQL